MPSRSRSLALAAIPAAAALLLVAGPAAAAPIADGTIFTTGWYGGQLYTADATSGALTTVGSSSGTNWISGLDFDGATGIGYAVTYVTDPAVEDGPDGPATLYLIDPVTGLTTLIGPITVAGEPVAHCLDLDYSEGEITVVCDGNGGASSSFIATVDPATAAATVIVPTIDRSQGIARNGDLLVVFGFEGIINTVDLTDDSVTNVGVVATSGLYPTGADFDAAGVLYVSSAASMEPYNLYTFDVATLTGELIGPMGLDGVDVGSGEDISVTGTVTPAVSPAAPTLPNTGVDAVPLALAGALAVLGGLVALAAGRRRLQSQR